MPRSYPPETRLQVIELARSGIRVALLASTFGMSEATIYSWLKQEQVDRGEVEGFSTDQALELAAAKRRRVRSPGLGGAEQRGPAANRVDAECPDPTSSDLGDPPAGNPVLPSRPVTRSASTRWPGPLRLDPAVLRLASKTTISTAMSLAVSWSLRNEAVYGRPRVEPEGS